MESSKFRKNLLKVIFSILLVYIVCAQMGRLEQICVIDDEFGYWGVAAYFAGYDWTGLTPTSPYYGYGLGFIYMFLFKIFNDPVIMYKAAIVLNAIFLVIAYHISLKCIEKIYPDLDWRYVYLFCSLASLYPNTIVQSQVGWTENLLYLWFWICVFLVIKIWEKASAVNCCIFAVFLLYGYMVHQRTLGVIISGILIIMIAMLLGKISGKKGFIFFISCVLSIVACMYIKTYLTDNFWISLDQRISEMNNIGGQVEKIRYVFSIEGIYDLLMSISGKALYLIVSTGGLIIAVGTAVMLRVCAIGRKVCQKNSKQVNRLEYISLFLFLSFGATFAITAISMVTVDYRLDVLLYGRYNEFVVGPLLAIGCVEMKNYAEKNKWFLPFSGCLIAIAGVVSHKIHLVNSASFHATNSVGVAHFFSSMNDAEYRIFEIVVCILIVVCIGELVACGKKMQSIGIAVTMCLFLICFLWIPEIRYGKDVIYMTQQLFEKPTSNVAEYIRDEMESENIKYVLADKTEDGFGEDLYDRYIKYIQFYLYDKKIECINLSEIKESTNNVYIVRKKSKAYKEMCMNSKLVFENEMYGVFR